MKKMFSTSLSPFFYKPDVCRTSVRSVVVENVRQIRVFIHQHLAIAVVDVVRFLVLSSPKASFRWWIGEESWTHQGFHRFGFRCCFHWWIGQESWTHQGFHRFGFRCCSCRGDGKISLYCSSFCSHVIVERFSWWVVTVESLTNQSLHTFVASLSELWLIRSLFILLCHSLYWFTCDVYSAFKST